MMHILIVSPKNDTTGVFTKALSQENFVIEHAETGEKGLEKIWSNHVSFVLVGLELSGISGLEVLRIIRQDQRSRHIPTIAFTEKPTQEKILTAFNLEVDDCIAKPFHPEELLARVKAVLHRRQPGKYQKGEVITKGKIRVHLSDHRVVLENQEVKLTPKEYEILLLLLKKEGRVLSRQYLLEYVWGLNHVNTRSVDMLLARLRKKLRKEGARLIETVPGYGYRIVAKP